MSARDRSRLLIVGFDASPLGRIGGPTCRTTNSASTQPNTRSACCTERLAPVQKLPGSPTATVAASFSAAMRERNAAVPDRRAWVRTFGASTSAWIGSPAPGSAACTSSANVPVDAVLMAPALFRRATWRCSSTCDDAALPIENRCLLPLCQDSGKRRRPARVSPSTIESVLNFPCEMTKRLCEARYQCMENASIRRRTAALRATAPRVLRARPGHRIFGATDG